MQEFDSNNYLFPTRYSEIIQRVNAIEPKLYCSSRNFLNGAVTGLSPYISRGIISTKYVFNEILDRGFKPKEVEKLIQELAWRDYWQQQWIVKGEAINQDLKKEQIPVAHKGIPKAVLNANTGINAIDKAIDVFYETGYLHNHMRMYIASITCNIGQSHWQTPAKWMYFHLLDADWASNSLSWQWVAGTNSNKKYIANQENVNKYCLTKQSNTFIDMPYDEFKKMEIPDVLNDIEKIELKTILPKTSRITIDKELPTCLYNFYNLDPNWKKDAQVNRILLLEPSHFKKYPVSPKTIDFILDFAKLNIENVKVYVGEFNEFITDHESKTIYYKEHPLSKHYQGTEYPRDWMFNIKGDHPSFFAFWKKCKKQLNY